METLVIGSRGSALALWQARWTAARLAELGVETRIEIIKTTGDKITSVPLAQVGSKGLFTKEIEDALLDGRIDLAVHSLKDLPTELPEGLVLAAVPERESPCDALLGKTLDDLPQGAKVGTSSLRRAAQLRAVRPDLHIESLRGNLDTRVRKLDEGQYDAIVLAEAGLRRLGWADRIAQTIPPALVCPAVGQGALGIETRAGGPAREIVARLNHAATNSAVTAERAVLHGLGGGCQVPIGANADIKDGQLHLTAVVISPDGARAVRASNSGNPADAEALGAAMAQQLLAEGGREILADVYGEGKPLDGRRIVVTRAKEQAGDLVTRLRVLGAEVIELPVITFRATDPQPIRDAAAKLGSYDWLLFTSANGVRYFFDAAGKPAISARIGAIGSATAAALRERGYDPALLPDESVAESLIAALSTQDLTGKRILLPRALVARDILPGALRQLGATVDVVPVYETHVPEGLADAAQSLFKGASRPHWVTITSASTVKNLLAAAGPEALAGVKLASIGPVTSDVARRHGLAIACEADPYDTDGLVNSLLKAEQS